MQVCVLKHQFALKKHLLKSQYRIIRIRMPNSVDPEKLSFSQAQGYEELPVSLKLEELNQKARTKIWNCLYIAVSKSVHSVRKRKGKTHRIKEPWVNILVYLHAEFFGLPIDEFSSSRKNFIDKYKDFLCGPPPVLPFNKIFDLLQHVMRSEFCPREFTGGIAKIFEECQLAYKVDETQPVTIYPVTTQIEGEVLIKALDQLRKNNFFGAEEHLRKASDFLNQSRYADSIRESINAVESVARKLDPNSSSSLNKALKKLQEKNSLHPALKKGLQTLYGYTSDEEGIRHPLIDDSQANVGIDEAVFMLGACASFASYLLRKYKT